MYDEQASSRAAMSAPSSLCRRLRGLFQPSPSTPLPKPYPKPPPTTLKSIFNTPNLSQLVQKFKHLSRSRRFRGRQGIYAHTVFRLASAGNHSAIDEILQFQKNYDNIRDEGFVIRLISLYGSSGMLDHARKLFDEMPQLSCPQSVKSFNSLLKAAVQVGNLEECQRIFHQVPPISSIEPDAISYNILIHSLCEKGELGKAVSMVGEMEGRGVRPSLATYNTILDAFYEGGRFSDAEKIWAAMEEKGLEAATRTHNGKIRGLMIHGRMEDAALVMEEIGTRADAYSYGHMIQGFFGKGKMGAAEGWCEKLLERKELVPLKSTVEVMMSLAQKVGNAGLAMRSCEQAIQQRYWVKKGVVQGAVGLICQKFGEEEGMMVVVRLKAMGCQADCESSSSSS